jgi:hypothetical protein
MSELLGEAFFQLTSTEAMHRWQGTWAAFWQRVAGHMFGVAREHVIDEAFEPRDSQPALAMSALPDPEAATPSSWLPYQLSLPPEEPAGATATLLSRVNRDRVEDWAASWILYHLALARAVRELRGKGPAA